MVGYVADPTLGAVMINANRIVAALIRPLQ
jgi:hypothetical protein